MSNIKISQLPDWSGGNTTGSFIVMNDSGSAATYKVRKEAWMFPYNGSANISGSLHLTGSLRIRDTAPMFLSAPSGSGSITFSTRGSTSNTSIYINSVGTSSIDSSTVVLANVASSGQYSDQIQLKKISGSFFFYDSQEIGPSTSALRTVFEIKSNLSGSSTYSPVEFKRNVEVTGSLNVSSSASSGINWLRSNITNGQNVIVSSNNVIEAHSGSNALSTFNNANNVLQINGTGKNKIIGTTEVTGSLNVSSSAALATNPSVNVVGNIRFTNPLGVSSYQNVIEFSSGSVPESGSVIQYLPSSDVLLLKGYRNNSSVTIGQINGNNNLIGNTTLSGSNIRVTGSVNITNKLNLASQNPLPAGVLGDLAVSSSNALYFHNGTAWTLIS